MPVFEYVSGGYFRQVGVPKGKTAAMVHGMEVLQVVMAYLVFGQETK